MLLSRSVLSILLLFAALGQSADDMLDLADEVSLGATPCDGNRDGQYCRGGCDMANPGDSPACAKQCDAGTVARGGTGSRAKNCKECDEGEYSDRKTEKCVATCGIDFAGNATGFAGNAASGDCEKCRGSHPYADQDPDACLSMCPSGKVGSISDDGIGHCNDCSDSQYADSDECQ